MFKPTVYENVQLIADTAQPINSAGGYISADLKRGAVLCSTVKAANAKAKKSITFTGNPVASKEIVVIVNGTEVAYTTGSTTLATEVSGLASAINTAVGSEVTATAASGKLSIEAKENGLDGNAITMSAVVGASGITAGDLTVDVVGALAGDEIFEIVDSQSGTDEKQKPVAVLLEDAAAGEIKTVAFTGSFVASSLKFKAGQGLGEFKKSLRAVGIFTKGSI